MKKIENGIKEKQLCLFHFLKFNKHTLGFFNLFLINNYTRVISIGATYALTESKLTRGPKLQNGANIVG